MGGEADIGGSILTLGMVEGERASFECIYPAGVWLWDTGLVYYCVVVVVLGLPRGTVLGSFMPWVTVPKNIGTVATDGNTTSSVDGDMVI